MCVEQSVKTYWRQRRRSVDNSLYDVLQTGKVNIGSLELRTRIKWWATTRKMFCSVYGVDELIINNNCLQTNTNTHHTLHSNSYSKTVEKLLSAVKYSFSYDVYKRWLKSHQAFNHSPLSSSWHRSLLLHQWNSWQLKNFYCIVLVTRWRNG